jgi:hypothetical protein
MSLIDRHIERLVEDGRSIKTLDTYRYDARKLAKLVGGVRVGEASPARLDAALRSMRTAHGPTMATSAHIWMTLCVRCYGSGASSSVMISTVTESARATTWRRSSIWSRTRPHTTGNVARNGWPAQGRPPVADRPFRCAPR